MPPMTTANGNPQNAVAVIVPNSALSKLKLNSQSVQNAGTDTK